MSMLAQVISQPINPLREQRYLYLWGTGIGLMNAEASYNLFFLRTLQRHWGEASCSKAARTTPQPRQIKPTQYTMAQTLTDVPGPCA
jgi:hypothetical protein